MIDMFLYDENEKSNIRFVSFVGEHRHDLALIRTDRYYGKTIVLNIQSNRFGIIGRDDLAEEGYLEYVFNISSEEAEELSHFLNDVIEI